MKTHSHPEMRNYEIARAHDVGAARGIPAAPRVATVGVRVHGVATDQGVAAAHRVAASHRISVAGPCEAAAPCGVNHSPSVRQSGRRDRRSPKPTWPPQLVESSQPTWVASVCVTGTRKSDDGRASSVIAAQVAMTEGSQKATAEETRGLAAQCRASMSSCTWRSKMSVRHLNSFFE